MSEITQILYTSALTIIGGVVIFALSRFVEIFCAEPINNLNRLRGDIAHKLVLHANKFGNETVKKETMNEISSDFRELASTLRSSVYLIKGYKIFSSIGMIEPKENILNASSELIGLSNSVESSDFATRDKRIADIEKYLNVKT